MNKLSKQNAAATNVTDTPLPCEPNTKADLSYLKSQLQLFTNKNDDVRASIISTCTDQWRIGTNRGVPLSLGKGEKVEVLATLEGHGFDTNALSTASNYLLKLLHNVSKAHINDTSPPKRFPRPSPNRTDVEVMEATRRDRQLINMAFPEIAENVIDGTAWCIDRETGEQRPLTRDELKHPDQHILDTTLCNVPIDRAKRGMGYAAAKNQFHPLKRELDKCASEFKGGREEALNLVQNLSTMFFSNDSAIANTVMEHLVMTQVGLINQDKKVFCPQFCVVLAGDQGTFKSTFWETFGTMGAGGDRDGLVSTVSATPDKFFNDITYRSVTSVMEFAEIERFITGSHLDSFKNAITDKSPLGRLPYDVATTRRKRFSLWVGSTNKPNSILTDRSSSYDRRLVPILLPDRTAVDIDRVDKTIRQVWGAAAFLYGQQYLPYPHSLPSAMFDDLGDYQADFYELTPLEEGLLAYASGVDLVIPSEALQRTFNLPARDVTDKMIAQARSLFRTQLPGLGFEKDRTRYGNRRVSSFKRHRPLTFSEMETARTDANRNREEQIKFPSPEYPINLDF